MNKLYIFLIFVNILCVQCTRKKMIRVERFESCYQPPNVPFKIHYLNLNHLSRMQYSVSASGEIFEEIRAQDSKVSAELIKCRSKELLDSCEKLPTVTPPNICNLIEINEMGIRETLDKVKPPIHCPIQKGNYTARNVRYTVEQFTLFPLGNYYWKVKANVYHKKRLVASICLDVQSYG